MEVSCVSIRGFVVVMIYSLVLSPHTMFDIMMCVPFMFVIIYSIPGNSVVIN